MYVGLDKNINENIVCEKLKQTHYDDRCQSNSHTRAVVTKIDVPLKKSAHTQTHTYIRKQKRGKLLEKNNSIFRIT